MIRTRHTYHLNPLRLAAVPAIWLAVVVPLLLFGFEPGSMRIGSEWLAVGGVFTLALLLPQLLIWQSRIELTDVGITHFQFGYTVRSTWANVESISLLKGEEGLYLIEPGTKSALLRFSARIAGNVLRMFGLRQMFGNPDALAEGRFIPLIPFMHHWKSGALRADLQQWAPRLLQNLTR